MKEPKKSMLLGLFLILGVLTINAQNQRRPRQPNNPPPAPANNYVITQVPPCVQPFQNDSVSTLLLRQDLMLAFLNYNILAVQLQDELNSNGNNVNTPAAQDFLRQMASLALQMYLLNYAIDISRGHALGTCATSNIAPPPREVQNN